MFGLHFSRLGSVNILAPINRALSFISALSSSITPQRGSAATFTRSTTATYVDDSGVIQTAAINTPRFQGGKFLSEPARTNLLVRSQEFDNAAWLKGGPLAVSEANSTVAPDGTKTGDTFSTTNAGYFWQDVTIAGTSQLLGSVYFHASSTCTSISLVVYWLNNTTQSATLNLNPATGAYLGLGGTASSLAYEITPVGNGWYRATVSGVGTNALNTFCRVQMFNNVASPNTLVLWGAQLEVGNKASSYIPTVGATVTRAADSLTYPVTASPTQGGFSCTLIPAEVPAKSGTFPDVSLYKTFGVDHFGLQGNPGNSNLYLFLYAGGALRTSTVISSITANTNYKVAFSWNALAGTISYSVNGGVVSVISGLVLPSVAMNLFSTASGNLWNGQLSDVKVFTQTLSDSTLRQLTT